MRAPYKDGQRWQIPDQEWLEYQHDQLGKTYVQIAAEAGTSDSMVYKWMKTYRHQHSNTGRPFSSTSPDGVPRKAGPSWLMPSKTWLEYQHFELGKNYTQLAEEVGCHKNVMKKWVKKLQPGYMPTQPTPIGTGRGRRFVGLTYEWLYDQYVVRDRTSPQIAADLKTESTVVCHWLRKLGIPIRSLQERSGHYIGYMQQRGWPNLKGHGSAPYQHKELFKRRPNVCEWCGTVENLQMHHLDHNGRNGAPENLIILCRNCNTFEGHLNSLVKAGRATWVRDPDRQTLTIQFVVAPVIRALEPGAEGHRGAR